MFISDSQYIDYTFKKCDMNRNKVYYEICLSYENSAYTENAILDKIVQFYEWVKQLFVKFIAYVKNIFADNQVRMINKLLKDEEFVIRAKKYKMDRIASMSANKSSFQIEVQVKSDNLFNIMNDYESILEITKKANDIIDEYMKYIDGLEHEVMSAKRKLEMNLVDVSEEQKKWIDDVMERNKNMQNKIAKITKTFNAIRKFFSDFREAVSHIKHDITK